jgi:hypothetical protein
VTTRRRVLAVLLATTCLGLALAGPAFADSPAWSPVGQTGPTVLPPIQGEIQDLRILAGGGTFNLSYEGATTGPIAFDADAGAVESALDGLVTIGGAGGSVYVIGGPGDPEGQAPYSIAFGGTLTNRNLLQIVVDGSLLTDAVNVGAEVATRLDGGPGTTELILMTQNIGARPSSGPITYKVTLPPGVTTTTTPTGGELLQGWNCSEGVQTEFTCTFHGIFGITPAIGPSATPPPIKATIAANPGAASGTIQMEVLGGAPKAQRRPRCR